MLSTTLYNACTSMDAIMGSDIDISRRPTGIVPILFSLTRVFDNAYSAISLSKNGFIYIFDDPSDEIKYSMWDITYRYELEGELIHDTRESYEDEYNFYPADFWVDNPEYSYPDGEINVTGTENTDDLINNEIQVIE